MFDSDSKKEGAANGLSIQANTHTEQCSDKHFQCQSETRQGGKPDKEPEKSRL